MKKKVGKLKLTSFGKAELDRSQLNALKGGYGGCVCVCCLCPGGITAMDYIDYGGTDAVAHLTMSGY